MLEPVTPRPSRHRFVRWLLFGVGAVSLLLGLIGIFLPLLPTVPFLLLTAACWTRASPRWHRWLLSRPRLGPLIERWERERTISRRARWAALGLITLSMGATVWWVRGHAWLPWAMTGLATGLLLLVARLPTARDGAH
ncbi:MAG: YbaN family protein [Rhodanobacter sp.]